MQREMLQIKRKLSDDESRALLSSCMYGVLSTVCRDGTPYGVPLSYAVEEDHLYFHCTKKGGLKLENIEYSNKACFTVVGPTQILPEAFSTLYLSVIAFGRISAVEDPSEKKHGLEALLRRYSPEHMESGLRYIEKALCKVNVLRFDILQITGKGRKK